MSQGFTTDVGMVGPNTATDNAIVRYNGTSGKILQDSSVLIDDSDNMSGVANLDTTGVTTMTGQPAFRAYRNASQSIPNSTWTKIQYNNETFDVSGEYDNATNYRFTVGTAGIYQINAAMSFGPLSGSVLGIGIYKNGSIVSEVNYQPLTGSNNTLVISDILSLIVNDYIEIYIVQITGGTQNTVAQASLNWFSMGKIA